MVDQTPATENQSQRSRTPTSDEEVSPAIDKYDPSIYRCTGYDVEGYVWFDGISQTEDRRFLIDLPRKGTMDK